MYVYKLMAYQVRNEEGKGPTGIPPKCTGSLFPKITRATMAYMSAVTPSVGIRRFEVRFEVYQRSDNVWLRLGGWGWARRADLQMTRNKSMTM